MAAVDIRRFNVFMVTIEIGQRKKLNEEKSVEFTPIPTNNLFLLHIIFAICCH